MVDTPRPTASNFIINSELIEPKLIKRLQADCVKPIGNDLTRKDLIDKPRLVVAGKPIREWGYVIIKIALALQLIHSHAVQLKGAISLHFPKILDHDLERLVVMPLESMVVMQFHPINDNANTRLITG